MHNPPIHPSAQPSTTSVVPLPPRHRGEVEVRVDHEPDRHRHGEQSRDDGDGALGTEDAEQHDCDEHQHDRPADRLRHVRVAVVLRDLQNLADTGGEVPHGHQRNHPGLTHPGRKAPIRRSTREEGRRNPDQRQKVVRRLGECCPRVHHGAAVVGAHLEVADRRVPPSSGAAPGPRLSPSPPDRARCPMSVDRTRTGRRLPCPARAIAPAGEVPGSGCPPPHAVARGRCCGP